MHANKLNNVELDRNYDCMDLQYLQEESDNSYEFPTDLKQFYPLFFADDSNENEDDLVVNYVEENILDKHMQSIEFLCNNSIESLSYPNWDE